jgi:hypothetical protein
MTEASPAQSSSHPPREWFEDHFVHDGQVTYCSECQSIPFAFIGHWCRTMEARACGIKAEMIDAPYRWEDVVPVGSGLGDWHLAWVGSR